jgi:hypothetical protein
MREIFVSELVRELLGPRQGAAGIRENISQNPLKEFMTGVLQPVGTRDLGPDRDDMMPSPHIGEWTGSGEEDTEPDEDGSFTVESPSLNPKDIPSTMGISFRVKADKKIKLKICITWARYLRNTEEDKPIDLWTRNPRSAIISASIDNNGAKYFFGSDGKETEPHNAEISLHAFARPNGAGKYLVSLYVVNRIHVPEPPERTNADHHIFQPQIRVVAPGKLANPDTTEIIESEATKDTRPEERKLEFLYRNRKFYARGHLTSAVWRDVDPEEDYTGHEIDYKERASDIPFAWADGELLSEEDRDTFTQPDVRTDYVPLYSITAPELAWNPKYGSAPQLNAGTLAETCKPQDLRDALLPIYDGYERWIQGLENNINENREISEEIIEECKVVLKRIKIGIDTVCDENNPDVTLAFCFANKAVDLQSRWARGESMEYWPFQLAYILMCIESVVNRKSDYRDVCDLMWVPTGTGKTEAYLALAVFTMAYRRRLALREEKTGAGVSIITRYTLRLLTIQQFRRTLSIITAAELLRVHNLAAKSSVGWRPAAWPDSQQNFIWGSSQFSAGLWIGGEATPNHLKKIRYTDGWHMGALDILSGERGNSEPAQIVSCPCCNRTLSITDSGLSGTARLDLVVMSTSESDISAEIGKLAGITFDTINVTEAGSVRHANPSYYTVSLTIEQGNRDIKPDTVDKMWNNITNHLAQAGVNLTLVPFRASRPGYFKRIYLKQNGEPLTYDFEIFCPNPQCELHVQWFRGSPAGSIHNRRPTDHQAEKSVSGIPLPDGNVADDVQDAFQENGNYIADRIPIPALIVDDQVYSKIPAIIVSTVDKFARPAFEPKSSSLFGKVDRHHKIHGYYSRGWYYDGKDPSPHSGTHQETAMLNPPDLILQDELHLIEGPLGSMVGIYETAIDFLCGSENKIKYIASTATIKRASDHVLALFARRLQTFPPHGFHSYDRFFVRDDEKHQLDDSSAGRLYLGISAPGKGPLTPIIRIWAKLAQTAWDQRGNTTVQGLQDKLDPFWTLTGYFNATKELAGTLGTYSQDIRERLQEISPNDHRQLEADKQHELSGRTSKAADLPKILEILNTNYGQPSCPDALFTTSMFGTGVDIPRLGLMLINGEPKTTSSYIQSSGRVGRKNGGLVITLLRAGKPRDLSHYEYFMRHHRQLHRFVEPPTAYPFASGVMERALGPVGVFILRHIRSGIPWLRPDTGAMEMEGHRNDQEVGRLVDIITNREKNQPETRKLPSNASTSLLAGTIMGAKLDLWNLIASQNNDLIYVEYGVKTRPHPVVLGDFEHQDETANVDVVYKNAPSSLRELEPETSFES